VHTPDPATIIANFDTIASILETVSILMGIGLFLGGLFLLKKYGETRTYMSHQMSIAGPLVMLIAGVAFLILPTTISTVLFAFWSSSTPEHYSGLGEGWDQYMPVVLIFVRIIGVGAIMRGILLFSRVGGHHGSQPGTMGKAFIHILGGLLCVHILGTVDLLKNIFDFT
jgi:intracellular multiplication protein IcmC